MKVRRTELTIKATDFSRDWAVPRSLGCHLMQVVHAIQPHHDPSYKKSPFSLDDLENFALPGFLWEHVMDQAERLEILLSDRAIKELKRIGKMEDGGEMFWCQRHDEVMWGGDIARDHCGLPPLAESTGDEQPNGRCKGLFWTPDARTVVDWPAEFKVTWLSANRTSETTMEIWKYVTQTQFQAWGFGAPGAEIFACFVNGDYSYPLTPRTYHFALGYSQTETSNCHSMIVSNARKLGWL